MSTTFEVFPATDELPRFGEVVALAEHRLRDFAQAFGLGQIPPIHFALHDRNENVTPLSSDERMQWPLKSYVWFAFGGAKGGTDAYFMTIDDNGAADWETEIEEREPARKVASLIRQCVRQRRRWSFRRSMGQPSIVNLGYGYLAAAVAEVTGGFIYSGDGAWDFPQFPCTANEFYRVYFRPSEAMNDQYRDWSGRNIEFLQTEGMES